MSRHIVAIDEDNVTTFLLRVLSEEDVNVVAAEEKLTKCLAAVEHHKQQVLMLREALRALGVDPDDAMTGEEMNY